MLWKWWVAFCFVVLGVAFGAGVHLRLSPGPVQADARAPKAGPHPLLDGLEPADRNRAAEWLRHREDQCYRHCKLTGTHMLGVSRFGCVCAGHPTEHPVTYSDHPIELPPYL